MDTNTETTASTNNKDDKIKNNMKKTNLKNPPPSVGKIFTDGLWKSNPVFVLLLGMCPTLAVTNSAINGLGMGVATLAVLFLSNVAISLLKNIIPAKMRIPAFIVIIASFVTIIGLLMQAYTPTLHKALGIFIPLIVVNCIILGRAEAFASRNSVAHAALDGLAMGLGFAAALTVMGAVREVLGSGCIFGYNFWGEDSATILIMVFPPGAFLTLGYFLALIRYINERAQKGTT